MESTTPRRSWFVRFFRAAVRTLFLTFLFTLLGMAVGLFFGIIITALRGHPMNEAYRVVAVPVAVFTGVCALLWNVVQLARREPELNSRRTSTTVMSKEESRRIRSEIRRVLLNNWDPIGVKDEPNAQDEYDSYIGEVFGLLIGGATHGQIAKHLSDIAERRMGLIPSHAKDQAAARELRSIC